MGVFCETPCAPCDAANGKCVFDGAEGACECRRDAPERRDERVAIGRRGRDRFGFTGPACDVPCEPCYNGTCSNEPGSYGQCLCDPGFADPACLIECGDPGFARVVDVVAGADDGASFGQSIVDISQGACTSAVAGESTPPARRPGGSARHDDDVRVRVHVDGAVVFARVSLPARRRARALYGERPGRRGPRRSVDHGDRVRTRLDGAPGGIPPSVRRAESRKKLQRAVSPVRARDVPRRRDVPVRVRIRVAGTAVQGSDGRDRAVHPFSLADDPMVVYEPEYHTCAARHPCNMNGELFNATCGPAASPGYADNLTLWTTLDPNEAAGTGARARSSTARCAWTRRRGKTRRTSSPWRTRSGTRSPSRSFVPRRQRARSATWGLIQGVLRGRTPRRRDNPYTVGIACAIPYVTVGFSTRPRERETRAGTTTTSRGGRGRTARRRASRARRTGCATRRRGSARATRGGTGTGA